MILDSIQFNDFVKICSGEFLRTPLLPFIDQKHYDRKCLIIGSCLANYILKKEIRFPSQLLIFNGGNLPNISGHIDNFDFVVVQMPLRYMLKDFELWNEGALDLDACEQVFNDAKVRLEHFFLQCYQQCKDKPILLMNFLVPVNNPLGKLFNRYSLTNLQFFVEELNKHLEGLTRNLSQVYLIDADSIASTVGKYRVSDEFYNHLNHAAPGEVDLKSDLMETDYLRFDPMPAARLHFDLDEKNLYGKMIANEISSITFSIFESTPIKLIVSDLDNTLWRGIVGEELESGRTFDHSQYVKNFYNCFGVEDIDYYKLSEGFPYGIMEALHYCKKRGIMLAIISKNNEFDGLEGLNRIYAGRLDLSNFVDLKINWDEKVKNMYEILKICNILPSNVLFIDDNPLERQKMDAAFPDMYIMGRYMFYAKSILHNSHLTSVASVSDESSRRTDLIRASLSIKNNISNSNGLEELEIRASVFQILADPTDPLFNRSFELINKTNQFNINGLRVTKSELLANLNQGGSLFALRVVDKYADHGLVGCILVNKNLSATIFVMSCRVIGLGVENYFANKVCQHLKTDSLKFSFVQTDKNFPAQMWAKNYLNGSALLYKYQDIKYIGDL